MKTLKVVSPSRDQLGDGCWLEPWHKFNHSDYRASSTPSLNHKFKRLFSDPAGFEPAIPRSEIWCLIR